MYAHNEEKVPPRSRDHQQQDESGENGRKENRVSGVKYYVTGIVRPVPIADPNRHLDWISDRRLSLSLVLCSSRAINRTFYGDLYI